MALRVQDHHRPQRLKRMSGFTAGKGRHAGVSARMQRPAERNEGEGTVVPASSLASESVDRSSASMTAQVLRRWCAPELILAVTDFADEETLLFHCIQQARHSQAAVILAHVLQSEGRQSSAIRNSCPAEPSSAVEASLRTLERMARQLRWVGIQCEPVLLMGDPTEELLAIIKKRGVDRLLLTAQSGGRRRTRTLAEELSPWAGVPVCSVQARSSSETKIDRGGGHIILAITLHPSCEILLRFAGRLAQEHDARLTILHVVESKDADAVTIDYVSDLLATRLFAGSLREAQLFCSVDLAVCTGDPANEILKLMGAGEHEFLIVGAPHSPCADSPGSNSPVHKLLREARCPVMLVGPATVQTHLAEPLGGSRQLLRAVR